MNIPVTLKLPEMASPAISPDSSSHEGLSSVNSMPACSPTSDSENLSPDELELLAKLEEQNSSDPDRTHRDLSDQSGSSEQLLQIIELDLGSESMGEIHEPDPLILAPNLGCMTFAQQAQDRTSASPKPQDRANITEFEDVPQDIDPPLS
ncbi:hypothetical protein JD844_011863 [Phrynosoma platyrhinos]|uniref:Uncharacterized protein n=1 Tax=Phrynosoma platyrhinos TaxID=52577 RepID=A0ABQ7TIN1_PHRPL|nr:hypothetical protein JD844_011863 [Phrynosoma platyrhinos]